MPTYEVKEDERVDEDFRGALEAVEARRLGDLREQRRYEIARDVMAATRAASWLSTRQTPDQSEVLASWALADAAALLAALEETER